MVIRKSVSTLSDAEKKSFVNALLELKRRGRYDEYVHWHHHVMVPTVFPYEPRDANYRNGAHRGPVFLPWHREFLLQLEHDLRALDPSLFIPYWDWTQDAKLADPTSAPIWATDLMGGNGLESDEWRVQTGPFAHSADQWPVPPLPDDGLPGPGLKRQFGTILSTLPTEDDLALALAEIFYDTPNYDRSPFTVGFRTGSRSLQASQNPDAGPHYAPERYGPPGHNLDDRLNPWTRTPREVLDITVLGYQYAEPPGPRVLAAPAAMPHAHGAAATTHAQRHRSPFWAD